MSATLEVFAVPLVELKRALGARDPGLLDAVAARCGWFFEQVDAIDDECGLTCREALGQILAGEPLDPELGFLYGYAFEALCRHLGEPLPSLSGIVGAADWIHRLDGALAAGNVPLRLSDLAYDDRPLPVALPTPDDFPFLGIWTPGVLPAALAPLRRFNVHALGVDPGLAADVQVVRGWVEAAAAREGTALIGVLS